MNSVVAHTNTHRLRKAVHHNRLASKRGLLERMFTLWFRGFVYNQIWEDPRVDAQALQLGPDSSLLTISSGGCNVLNYLVHEPRRIVAVDLNANHMALTRLKLAAIKHLPDYESFYKFFGYGRHEDNLLNYRRHLRDALDPQTRAFWESSDWPGRKVGPRRIGYFKRGLYEKAKLGQFFRVVHGLAKGMRRDPARLLAARTLAEQERVFEETYAALFRNRLVRWMGRQPVAVYSLGIPPSQHAAMLEEQGGDGDHENRRAVPDYLKRENYEKIRSLVDRVETHVASLADHLRTEKPGALNGFIFLDSQDWMPPHVIAELWGEIARVGGPNTRVIFRTAGEKSPIEAALPAPLMQRFRYAEERSRQLHLQDRSAIYGMFHLYEMTESAAS